MADGFEIVSQRLTKELVGAHDLVDVWEIGAKTSLHGIYFAFRVTKDQHTPEYVGSEAARHAAILETIRAHPSVTGVAYVQSIAPQGALVDELDVYYQSDDGRHHGELRVPLHVLDPDVLHRHLGEAVAHLHSVAAL